MNRLSHIVQKNDVFIAFVLTTSYSLSEIVFGWGDYDSVIIHSTSGIIDASAVNTNFSYRIDDSSSKCNDLRSIISSSYLNTSAILLSTKTTISQDINGFKNGAYLIQTSNEHLAYFIGATYL